MPTEPRPARRVVAPMLVGLVVTLGITGCSHERTAPRAAAEPPVESVEVLVTERTARPLVEQVVGTVTARVKPVVSAKVGGNVIMLGADVGDRVEAGQLLAEVEAREVQARLDQAVPQLERVRADAERYRELFEANAVSRQEYDEILARVRTMEATVEEARTMLDYTRITSPIDGIVRARRVEMGDLAWSGRPLFELEGLDDFRFDASIPEAFTGRLTRGDTARIRIDAPGIELTGTLAEITPAADPLSRTFLARYDLETDAPLISGQFGRLFLPVGDANELTIPRAALVQRGQLEIVFVVRDDRAALRLVKAGRIDDDGVTILSGLAEGETIVVAGADRLQDGQRVDVRP